MICPQCHTENRDGAKFCDECGFRLPQLEPSAVSDDASRQLDDAAGKVDKALTSPEGDTSFEHSVADEAACAQSDAEEQHPASDVDDGASVLSAGSEFAPDGDASEDADAPGVDAATDDSASEPLPDGGASEDADVPSSASDTSLTDLPSIDLGSLSLAEKRAESALSGWDKLEAGEGVDLHSQKTGEIPLVIPSSAVESREEGKAEPEASTQSREASSPEEDGVQDQAIAQQHKSSEPAADLSGFDEYLVDSSFVPPENAYRRGDTMKLPPISAAPAERTAFIAPDPAEKGKRRRSKASSADISASQAPVTPSPEASAAPESDAPKEKAPRKRSRGGRIALIAVAAVAVICAICAGVTYQMELWGGKVVPDVTTMTQSDAAFILRNKGFEVRSTSVPSDETEGIVLLMDPKAGSRQEAGSEVVIHVSVGRTIPDIVGKSTDEAKKLLEDSGFTNVSVTTEKSDDAEGSVLSVEPTVGSKAKAASAISVVVAEPYTVPDVDGMTVDAAANAIEEAGLVPSRIVVYDESVAEGSLLGVDPVSGTKVESGSVVTISVSKSRGSELVAAARSYLSGASLAASDGSTFAVASVDSCTYLGSDKVSFTATGRASTSVSVLGQTLSVSGDTKQVTGVLAFDANNNVTSVSFQ